MTRIFEPITITAGTGAPAVTLPASLLAAAGANAVVELQVHECAGTVNMVGDNAQTKGLVVPPVASTGWNAVVGHFDVQGFELYAYAAQDTTLVLIPVLIPRRR